MYFLKYFSFLSSYKNPEISTQVSGRICKNDFKKRIYLNVTDERSRKSWQFSAERSEACSVMHNISAWQYLYLSPNIYGPRGTSTDRFISLLSFRSFIGAVHNNQTYSLYPTSYSLCSVQEMH